MVERRVESGQNPNEVIWGPLRLFEHEEEFLKVRKQEFREQTAAGWLSAQAGELVDDEEVFRLEEELEALELPA